MSLSSLFNELEIKTKMLDIPYDEAEKERVLTRLEELQSKVENFNFSLSDDSVLTKIDAIIYLIQEKDMSLSQEIKDYLNDIYTTNKK